MFSSQTDHVRNAAKLLTAAIAFGASPGAKSGVSLYDAAKKLAGKPPKGLKAMSGRMADLAQTTFDGFKHDLPADAAILFAQMIEATLPTPELIAQQQMQAENIATAMASKLKDRAHRAAPMPQLFHDIVTPVVAELCKDKDFAADLTPAFMQEVLTQGAETAEDVKDIKAMMQRDREIEQQNAMADFQYQFAEMHMAMASARLPPHELINIIRQIGQQKLSALEVVDILSSQAKGPNQ